MIEVRSTALSEVVEIVPRRFADDRGWFSETWNEQRLHDAGIDVRWVQDNESLSLHKGTLRGLHFQRPPFAQDKLVRVVRGSIRDVAVDLRRSSPTFGQSVVVELSAEVGNQLFVPKGFGHGFVSLQDDCHVAYKVSAPYDPGSDAVVAWDDESLGINWGIDPATAHLSEKDACAPTIASASELLFS